MNDNPIRVLVIDDDVVDRVTVRRLLTAEGSAMVVAEATDTASGETALAQGGIDVVLCDHHLPGEDGLSFLQRLAGRPDSPPVIALTGQGDESLAVAMLKAGAADYLGKDRLSGPRLAATIRHVIAARRDQVRALRADAMLRRLERGMSGCARALLVDAMPARTLALALRHLAEAAEVARAVLFLNRDDDIGPMYVAISEALRDGHSLLNQPPRPWRPGLLRWHNDLGAGEQINGVIRHLPQPEQTALADDGIQSVLAIPLIVRNRWAGLVRFDRLTPIPFQREEARVLRAAAELVGVYLERQPLAMAATS
jgi:DNA-binding response OmpR family regulator